MRRASGWVFVCTALSVSALSSAISPTSAGASSSAWAGEALLSGKFNAWEPYVAADPASSYVYAIYNRFDGPTACRHCPSPPVVVRASSDGGVTWGKPAFVCACPGTRTQYDPTIAVTSKGVVYAVWLDWYTTRFAKSEDHGQTWSAPVTVSGAQWSDKPWIATSPNGRNVYVAWAHGDEWVASSHDYGATFSAPKKISGLHTHYYYPNGAAVLPDGTVLMSASSYTCGKGSSNCKGPVEITVFRSTDSGASWSEHSAQTVYPGVDFATSSTSTLAADGAGTVVLEYGGAATLGANGQVWVRHSTDGGLHWSGAQEVTPGPGSNASFPAIAAGRAGAFDLTYMDDRTGKWNVWFRSSTDGGMTWSQDVRLSDATSKGFGGPYGDYDGIAVTPSGAAVAVWGQGSGVLAGPGGIWFNRHA